MIKLLILADDLTGALDTGVKLAAQGIAAPVLPMAEAGGGLADFGALCAQVAVLDLQTRHLSPAQAYARVHRAVSKAIAAGARYVYKKTDSGLRGNIGAELQAVVDAGGLGPIAFAPAFPQMGRVTRGGIHYAGGVPVSMSSFGRDVRNPVRYDAVHEIIAAQSDISVTPYENAAAFSAVRDLPGGVLLFDAQTASDLRSIAEATAGSGIRLFAGCAALAHFLPGQLKLAPEQRAASVPPPDMLAISGSVSPLSFEQTQAARAAGIPIVSLTADDRLFGDVTAATRRLLPALRAAYARRGAALLLATTAESEIISGAKAQGVHEHIAGVLAHVAHGFYQGGGRPTLVVSGGDTLAATIRAFGAKRIEPMAELFDGVALSKLILNAGELWMVSKSGGFGAKTVYADIRARLTELAGEV